MKAHLLEVVQILSDELDLAYCSLNDVPGRLAQLRRELMQATPAAEPVLLVRLGVLLGELGSAQRRIAAAAGRSFDELDDIASSPGDYVPERPEPN